MHEFRILTKVDEWGKIGEILAELGSQLPAEGQGIIFAEFDESGEIVAFQVLQYLLCAEGLWAKEGKPTNLRTLWKMLFKWIEDNTNKGEGRTLFTIATSPQMARVCRLMKLRHVPKNWKLMRRVF